MNKKAVFTLSVLLSILISGSGEAFIPKAPHLLYLVHEKIKQPVGIEAVQTKKVVDHTSVSQGYVPLQERLIYSYPNHFRKEISSEHQTGFCVESEFRYVKVENAMVVSRDKPLLERYTDILLYRDFESLLQQMANVGIDTENVMLQRVNNRICYVIGAPALSGGTQTGLWIDKASLFPVKYAVAEEDWVFEFYYDNWQRVSKTWYPMQVSIFWDDQLYAVITVQSWKLKATKADSLFDIDSILRSFPGGQTEKVRDPDAPGGDDLNKQIEDFDKLLD